MSKLMSYTFHTAKEKEGRRRRGRDAEETRWREGPDDDRDRGMRGGRGWQGRSARETSELPLFGSWAEEEKKEEEESESDEDGEKKGRGKRRRGLRATRKMTFLSLLIYPCHGNEQ